MIVGGLTLAALALVLRRRRGLLSVTAPSRTVALTVGIGAVGVLVYQPMFFAGTRLTGVAVGTVLALGSAPIFTGLIDGIVFRRRPSRLWYAATTVAIVGLTILVLSGQAPTGGTSVLGIAACLAAGAGYATYACAAKSLLDRSWTPAESMGALFGVAAVAALPMMAFVDLSWLARPSGVLLAGWLGLATVTVAYLLYARGLQTVSAPTAATLTLAEPIAAALLGVVVLGEWPSTTAWIGVLLIGAGLAILVIGGLSRRRPAPEPAPSGDTAPAVGVRRGGI